MLEQSELNTVSLSNFVKFRLQSMSSKVEQAFEKKKEKKIPSKQGKKVNVLGIYKDHKSM